MKNNKKITQVIIDVEENKKRKSHWGSLEWFLYNSILEKITEHPIEHEILIPYPKTNKAGIDLLVTATDNLIKLLHKVDLCYEGSKELHSNEIRIFSQIELNYQTNEISISIVNSLAISTLTCESLS